MEYTERTREWLDERVAATVRLGRLRPSYYGADGAVVDLPVEHVLGLARALVILERLAGVAFSSCLDVGAGTGWLAYLIREHLGVAPTTVDLSREFSVWSRFGTGIPAYVANAAALPFADGSFDVVVCSEVLEHVEHPLAVLGELRRVARRAVVLTTQESCRDDWERSLLMAVAADSPHAERNFFLPDDFLDFFGARTEVEALMSAPERLRLFDLHNVDELASCVMAITDSKEIGPGSYGVLAASYLDDCRKDPVPTKREILDRILASDRALGGASGFRADWRPPTASTVTAGDSPASDRAASESATSSSVPPCCPSCREKLRSPAPDGMVCAGCGASYVIDREVPVLIAPKEAVLANEDRQRARPELEAFGRALARRRWSSAPARRGVRGAMRLQGFLRLPLSYRDKARLAWKVLVS